MKKSFPLVSEKQKPERLAEQIKGDVRKYLKRERRKALPEGSDFWDFDCRAGKSDEEAVPMHEREIGAAIDSALAGNWPSIYLEIAAVAKERKKAES